MKKLLFSLFTVFSFCVPSIAQQYSNPVINYSLPDPTVIKADVWGIERSGFFNGREKWAKGFENQRV